MTILDNIVIHKRKEVEQSKSAISVRSLENRPFFLRETASLGDRLRAANNSGIIAEFKRRSPSKGILNDKSDPVDVVRQYESAGASAGSILTDETFFGGSQQDLVRARSEVHIPLLRKDFMIDEYQFVEAKAMGADVVLLIASILTKNEVKTFTELAQGLGLEVLLELHGEEELDHVCHQVNLVGINNRNLKTFEVDMERSFRMAEKLGQDFILVAESGITSPGDIRLFRKYGFDGFLIGETFMRTNNPGETCREFISHLS
jgi:indole-3-glycerol phosphate synthase